METSFVLNTPLLPHQQDAVTWMEARERRSSDSIHVGGVLADGMGLGKTYDCIALIVRSFATDTATLVVVPLSILFQWRDQMVRHTTIGESNVVIYYGRDRCRNLKLSKREGRFVFLTTYETVREEVKIHEGILHHGLG